MQRFIHKLFLFHLFLGVWTPISSAEEIEGTDDPAYIEAVSLWLDGDDEISLTALAQLAADGNTAARFLLARIETLPRIGSVFLDSLSRQEKRALFRAPGGTFGVSWLHVLADEGNSFAELLLESNGPENEAANGITLIQKGERLAGIDLLYRGSSEDILNIAGSDEIPQSVYHLVWQAALDQLLTGAGGPTEEALLDEAYAAFSNGSLPALYFVGNAVAYNHISVTPEAARLVLPRYYIMRGVWPFLLEKDALELVPEFEDVLLNDEAYAFLARPCRSICPANPGTCTHAAFVALGGFNGVMTAGSPLETLLPMDSYLSSVRGRIHFLQMLRVQNVAGVLEDVVPCLGSEVQELRF